MDPLEFAVIALAGLAAGTVNTVVGSGTLITFPVLLACGYAPVTANVSNTIGLVPGSISGAVGYRRELAGQGRRIVRFGAASALGGLSGAVLLLTLPSSAFQAIVPIFIATALVLVVVQPRLTRRLAARGRHPDHEGGPLAALGVYGTGIYGGYFGAAQGIMLLAVLGVALAQDIHRTNALKNVLAAIVNGVAGVCFLFSADVAWRPAAIIAGSSIAGGQLGAHFGRRIPGSALRGLIVVVGVFAIAHLLIE